MKNKPHKLYVVVRNDLSPSQQAVQAGHALAEYLKCNPDTEWDNGTLVYLVVDEYRLENCILKLRKRNIDWVEFYEPDIGNQLTAIASLNDGRVFSNLPLM